MRPTATTGNEASEAAAKSWDMADRKARSNLVLAINPSELKQIKGCGTANEIWRKLHSIYQSKGPARKASLLKQLILHKMAEGEDVREQIRKFFDAVDKLHEMEVEINQDLLTILLLYSLPGSFENFRCVIESRDELPDSEALNIKIIEESDARTSKARENSPGAMMASSAWKPKRGKKPNPRSEGKDQGVYDTAKGKGSNSGNVLSFINEWKLRLASEKTLGKEELVSG